MKKSLIFFILIFSLATLRSANVAGAEHVSDAPVGMTAAQDSVAGMTDERLRAYEDSLIRALYPEVRECHLPDSLRRKDGSNGTEFPHVRIYDISDISNPILPDIVVPDKTKSPGEMEIRQGVTPTGARTYEVPVKTFPGINGFQPYISLTYNSQAGNSVAGHGGSVSGIPSITRGGKTIYHDGSCGG